MINNPAYTIFHTPPTQKIPIILSIHPSLGALVEAVVSLVVVVAFVVVFIVVVVFGVVV